MSNWRNPPFPRGHASRNSEFCYVWLPDPHWSAPVYQEIRHSPHGMIETEELTHLEGLKSCIAWGLKLNESLRKQGGPLAVLNEIITPLGGVITVFIGPFIGAPIAPFSNDRRGHSTLLVWNHGHLSSLISIFENQFHLDFSFRFQAWLTRWWQLKYVFYFHPEPWGRWTHFEGCICFKGVGSTTNHDWSLSRWVQETGGWGMDGGQIFFEYRAEQTWFPIAPSMEYLPTSRLDLCFWMWVNIPVPWSIWECWCFFLRGWLNTYTVNIFSPGMGSIQHFFFAMTQCSFFITGMIRQFLMVW